MAVAVGDGITGGDSGRKKSGMSCLCKRR